MENRICSIEGCGKKHSAKGFCDNHYMKWVRNAEPEAPEKKCNIDGCNKRIYAKGICHNHAEIFRRKGYFGYEKDKPQKKCNAPDCENLVNQRREYCEFHYQRMRNAVPFDRPKGIRGQNNPRWNGGTSEYKNHYQMKKISKEILKEANYKCFYCGEKSTEIHHLDHSKDNHLKENLVACCHKCNMGEYSKISRAFNILKERLQIGI